MVSLGFAPAFPTNCEFLTVGRSPDFGPLEADPEDVVGLAPDAEVMIGWHIPSEAIEAAPRLRLISQPHAGVDLLDFRSPQGERRYGVQRARRQRGAGRRARGRAHAGVGQAVGRARRGGQENRLGRVGGDREAFRCRARRSRSWAWAGSGRRSRSGARHSRRR